MLAMGVREVSDQYTFDPPSLLFLDTIAPALNGAELGRALGLKTIARGRCELDRECPWSVPQVSAFLAVEYIIKSADTLSMLMNYVSRPPPHGANAYAVGHEIKIRQRPEGVWEFVSTMKAWEQ
ncbi:MAG TPA: hypothetical protein VK966_13225 [Longimicrobiales bacterium]|nr:hypothetical protein [Longimicrobiales bacterium]